MQQRQPAVLPAAHLRIGRDDRNLLQVLDHLGTVVRPAACGWDKGTTGQRLAMVHCTGGGSKLAWVKLLCKAYLSPQCSPAMTTLSSAPCQPSGLSSSLDSCTLGWLLRGVGAVREGQGVNILTPACTEHSTGVQQHNVQATVHNKVQELTIPSCPSPLDVQVQLVVGAGG